MAEQEGMEIKIPTPPASANNQGYYFIYGEWMQFAQTPSIATADNPNPTGQVMQRIVGLNECIAMHPVVYWVMIQNARPGYKIKESVPMSKELYYWYKEVERRMNEAQAQLEAQEKFKP